MLKIVLLHVVVVRVEFTNLFIKHLEPCLACSKCSVSVMVISVICGFYAHKVGCLKEKQVKSISSFESKMAYTGEPGLAP